MLSGYSASIKDTRSEHKEKSPYESSSRLVGDSGMNKFSFSSNQVGSSKEDPSKVQIITTENNILVNAIQRFSSVIIHKSLKEGFGLAVTEALWKSKPVVASNVGGIPIQIINEKNGFLIEPNNIKDFAEKIIYLLENRFTEFR